MVATRRTIPGVAVETLATAPHAWPGGVVVDYVGPPSGPRAGGANGPPRLLSGHGRPGRAASERLRPHVAAAIVDVFVYTVVLNLFVEYFPQVLSETFTLSLLTAVLLKGVLEVVFGAKNAVKARFRRASTPMAKAVAALLLWGVLFGSKFLVLETVDLVFGSRVSLGGFVPVTLLILVLMLSRAAVRRLLVVRPAGERGPVTGLSQDAAPHGLTVRSVNDIEGAGDHD